MVNNFVNNNEKEIIRAIADRLAHKQPFMYQFNLLTPKVQAYMLVNVPVLAQPEITEEERAMAVLACNVLTIL